MIVGGQPMTSMMKDVVMGESMPTASALMFIRLAMGRVMGRLNRIKIVKGIEIGLQKGSTLRRCEKEAKSFEYDFIIGSFHCFDGYDLYNADYDEMKKDEILPNFYKCM